jgi:hypothetical protein
MSSTVQRSFTRIVAPVVLVALLALLTAWQGGVRAAEGRAAAAGDDGTTISVHGDWTIDVYAADGELVGHRAFSNALDQRGAVLLAGLLTDNATLPTDPWIVAFECGYGGSRLEEKCAIRQAGGWTWTTGEHTFTDLEVQFVEDQPGFALQGSAVAPTDFTLGRVETWLHRTEEVGVGVGRFTSRDLPADERIDILEGQSIVIRVELSFS